MAAQRTALVLGDQLMRDNPALEGADRVLFVESRQGMARWQLHRRRAHLS
jgi:deoxyribodipyrimidine photolyase-related protein